MQQSINKFMIAKIHISGTLYLYLKYLICSAVYQYYSYVMLCINIHTVNNLYIFGQNVIIG